MNDYYYAVSVEKDLADLIPTYLANRAKEVATLRDFLSSSHFDQLGRVGHRMKGVGEPYGFKKVSEFGKLIQDSADARDRLSLERCIGEYAEYLQRVNIVYK